MQSRLFPKDVMDDVFDIVRKQDKMYVILKEQRKLVENKVRELLGEEDVEIFSLFDVFSKKMFRDMVDSISIFDNEPLLDKFGLKEYAEIVYDLANLNQSRKMLFNYGLFGRRGNKGVLQDVGGLRISRSTIMVPTENQEPVENFIKKWEVQYSKRVVLEFLEGV